MNEFDFNMGVHVHCQDGQCGKLAKVVLNPDTWQVTDLIVEEGFLLKRARVFPIAVVTTATAEDIYLSISSDDLGNFPEYREVEYEVVASDSKTLFQDPYSAGSLDIAKVPMVREKIRQGITSEELLVVQQGTPVFNAAGKVGKLDHVITNEESNQITHLVVRQGTVFSEQLLIPAFMVEHVGEKGILIAPTDNELKELARYTPEEGIGGQTGGQTGGLTGGLTGGEAELTYAGALPHDDPTLSVQVAAALSADPRTRGAIVEVTNHQGTITLAGQVDSWRTRQAAGEVAAQQPGVVSVTNSLEITAEKSSNF